MNSPLSDDERQKIRFEEEYRLEVRSKLAQTDSKGKPYRVWTFLNSSFGLWFLSAVCITGLGSLYAQWHDGRIEQLKKFELAQVEELKNTEAIERLDLEIGYRLSQIQARLNSLTREVNAQARTTGVIEVLNSVSQPSSKNHFAAYPEFANYSLVALVAESKRRLRNEEERSAMNQILAHLTGIHVLVEVEKAELSNIIQVASVINKTFIHRTRWAGGQYYFLDCGPESPLC